VLRYTYVAYLITSSLPDQGDDTVGDLLRTALKDILIFQLTSFTEELLTSSCQPITNIPPGVFPEILYTCRHACKKKALKYWSRCDSEVEDREQERSGESFCTMEKRGIEYQHIRQVKWRIGIEAA